MCIRDRSITEEVITEEFKKIAAAIINNICLNIEIPKYFKGGKIIACQNVDSSNNGVWNLDAEANGSQYRIVWL